MNIGKVETTLAKEIIARAKINGQNLLASSPVKASITQGSDCLQLTDPIIKAFSSLDRQIASAKTEEELIILGQKISKFTDAENLKTQLQLKYFLRYESFYKELYKGRNISPKNLFFDMFGKDLNKEEAEILCRKYKSIFEEPDLEQYLEKLFIQVKKDFGLDYLPIELKTEVSEGVGTGVRGYMDFLDNLTISYNKDTPINRHKLFGLLVHELNHAKQTEIAIATDFLAYLKASASNMQNSNKNLSMDYLIQYVAKTIGPEKLNSIRNKYGKIDKNSKLYEQGMTYIEGQRNYKGVKDFTEEAFLNYKQQPLEKESYDAQSKANELYYYLTELCH